jgi:hypothetical protein
VKGMRSFLALAAIFMSILAVAPAAAQSVTDSAPGAPRLSLDRDLFRAAPQGGGTPIDLRVQAGGVFCCSEAGFILGGGIGARPFNNKRIEVVADLSFMRFGGGNGIYFSGDGLYHFSTDEPRFSPFAGAGLGILHANDHTEARFQIAGGVVINGTSPNPIRPEIRFVFTEDDVTTVLLVSIGVGRR